MKQQDDNSTGSVNTSDTSPLITIDGQPFAIPEEGTLGLLAMGYAGIMLWRDKRYRTSTSHDSTKAIL